MKNPFQQFKTVKAILQLLFTGPRKISPLLNSFQNGVIYKF